MLEHVSFVVLLELKFKTMSSYIYEPGEASTKVKEVKKLKPVEYLFTEGILRATEGSHSFLLPQMSQL